MASRESGNIGEAIAKAYLINHGYTILNSQYYSPYGEVDIIAKVDSYIIFVEVRYRKNSNFGTPMETVNTRKQQKIKKTALYYIGENGITNMDFRFDIIEITGQTQLKLNHIQNAF